MVRYVLIISQYYHSYIQKICMVQDDFIDEARRMIEELEAYKRKHGEMEARPVHYGDLDEQDSDRTEWILEKGGRININDAGDIYFELSNSIDHLVNEVIEYADRSTGGYKSNRRNKEVTKAVSEHHDRAVVTSIIKKHFVII